VFKSTSGGLWIPADTGLTPTSAINDLAIDPSAPGTIYAGTWGVYKTTNSGDTWNPARTDLPYEYVRTLAIDPNTIPSTLYAGLEDQGVYKSTNSGDSWVSKNIGLTNTDIMDLTIDPTTPGTLYAGTWGDGLFRSMNGGDSWSNIGLIGKGVYILAIDPTNTSILYAGTNEDGVYKSINGGISWDQIYAEPNPYITSVESIAIDPVNPSLLYATIFGSGVVMSTNSGGSWSPINSGLTNLLVSTLLIDPVTAGTVYAGMYLPGGGVFQFEYQETITLKVLLPLILR
jgi:hypothetical protein